MQSLMHAAVVVPADEFGEDAAQLSFIPNQHPVKTLLAKRPDEPFHVCRRVGGAIWDGNSSDTHLLPEPGIKCRSARNRLACLFHSERTAELTELAIVVVKEELGLALEAGVADLLFCPLKRWMICHMEMKDLAACKLHDDEYIKNPKANGVLHKEVATPQGLSLVL